MKRKNKFAVALGRMARGVPKTMSEAARQARLKGYENGLAKINAERKLKAQTISA